MYYHFKHRHTHKYFWDYRFLYAIGSHCSIFIFTVPINYRILVLFFGKEKLSQTIAIKTQQQVILAKQI